MPTPRTQTLIEWDPAGSAVKSAVLLMACAAKVTPKASQRTALPPTPAAADLPVATGDHGVRHTPADHQRRGTRPQREPLTREHTVTSPPWKDRRTARNQALRLLDAADSPARNRHGR